MGAGADAVSAALRRLILGFVIPAAVVAVATPVGATSRAPLTAFVLHQYAGEGAPVRLAAYRGKVVLVNFWATWCPPCVAEFPSLLALKARLSDQPFEILAINMGETDAAIAGFIDRLGLEMNFPILIDRPVTVATTWPVRVLPTTLVVDKAGNLAFKADGERAWNSAESRMILWPLLRE